MIYKLVLYKNVEVIVAKSVYSFGFAPAMTVQVPRTGAFINTTEFKVMKEHIRCEKCGTHKDTALTRLWFGNRLVCHWCLAKISKNEEGRKFFGPAFCHCGKATTKVTRIAEIPWGTEIYCFKDSTCDECSSTYNEKARLFSRSALWMVRRHTVSRPQSAVVLL